MAEKQNQHQKYAYEVLPLVFHNETLDFISFLRRDGNKFLKFWWERAGVGMEESLLGSSDGIDHEIRHYKDGRQIVLVKLPSPRKEPEAYYLAMVTRPLKRSLLSWRNLARVFALSRSADDGEGPRTVLAELTRSARYVSIGKGPRPNMNAFFDAVCSLLDQKK